MFTLKIKTGSDAFSGRDRTEVALILRRLVNILERYSDDHGRLTDTNGNIVGEWKLR